ncbi:hypothetical protein PHLGIDRAFT_351151 [Phlebiopsis gigantea 11061_1 CR5-6]|uniref:MYND-type domain-containing protein n=1 Tax=Phlebiopsis gigantea (strain 11061_1 CR5-6) TaxID=745531 RepID=A0A0C3NUM7_PHLG1|nr:hypothetical protein PHLGIDRAFT_351151 [Phlebiopsis gigantea 11061_1 CR5-6]
MFTVYTAHAETFIHIGEPGDDGDDFRADVRRVWHRTREELEALSPSVAPRRTQMIDLWTELGRKCGVDVDAPYDPSTEFNERGGPRSQARGKRCGWRECLCFGDRPSHRLKVCKRCTKVFYCSAKCQTRCVCSFRRLYVWLTSKFEGLE